MRFVLAIVREMSISSKVGYDDAMQVGLLEYWRAAARWDRSRSSWEKFARNRVFGAIWDEWRRCDYLTRHHRSAVVAGEDEATVPLHLEGPWSRGRAGSEVFDGLCHASPIERLEHVLGTRDDGDHGLRLAVEEAYEEIHRSKPRVAAVMRLYYQQEWLDREIAEFLGVDDSRVCQIRIEGHEMMRGLLALELLDP